MNLTIELLKGLINLNIVSQEGLNPVAPDSTSVDAATKESKEEKSNNNNNNKVRNKRSTMRTL